MTAIALAIFIVAILYVMIWSIRNDGRRSIGEQTGFLRMRDPSSTARKPGEQRGHRRGAGSRTSSGLAKK